MIDRSYVAPSSVGSVRQRVDRGVPGGALRRVAPAVDVLERRVVRGDRARPGRRPRCYMLQIVIRCSIVSAADRLAAVLEDVAGPAADADPGDQGEDDVLGADAGREPAVDADLVGLRLALEQRLRREDHLDLARPDPERQRPERAVGRRVRVAADDRHAGLGQPELRADDVDDPLARRAEAVERDPELLAVARRAGRPGPRPSGRRSAGSAGGSASSGRRSRPSAPGGGRARPRARSPVNACGEVTSWTRWRSTARIAGAPGSWRRRGRPRSSRRSCAAGS